MKVVSVRGISKSGKTTTIERVIAELRRRRYSVGSVKDIHFEQFAIDEKGTNTWRHREAGSQLVTARGLTETDVLFPERLPMSELIRFYNHDWLVLEGVDDFNVPFVICGHDVDGLDRLMDPRVIAVAGVIASEIDSYQGLPVFDARVAAAELVDLLEQKVPTLLPTVPPKCCQLCGMSCEQLLAAIVAGEKSRDDCLLTSGKVHLQIGGQDIHMVPFVKEVLWKTISALVSTLDGYYPHQEISIRLEAGVDAD